MFMILNIYKVKVVADPAWDDEPSATYFNTEILIADHVLDEELNDINSNQLL